MASELKNGRVLTVAFSVGSFPPKSRPGDKGLVRISFSPICEAYAKAFALKDSRSVLAKLSPFGHEAYAKAFAKLIL